MTLINFSMVVSPLDLGQIGASLRNQALLQTLVLPIYLLLPSLPILIMQGEPFSLFVKRIRLGGTCFSSLLLLNLRDVVNFGVIKGLEGGLAKPSVWSDVNYFSMDSLVLVDNIHLTLLVLPVKSHSFVFLMYIIDGTIGLQIFGDVFSLSIVDLLDLSKVLHVHFISHLSLNHIS